MKLGILGGYSARFDFPTIPNGCDEVDFGDIPTKVGVIFLINQK